LDIDTQKQFQQRQMGKVCLEITEYTFLTIAVARIGSLRGITRTDICSEIDTLSKISEGTSQICVTNKTGQADVHERRQQDELCIISKIRLDVRIACCAHTHTGWPHARLTFSSYFVTQSRDCRVHVGKHS
jgi:hypothetical protein